MRVRFCSVSAIVLAFVCAGAVARPHASPGLTPSGGTLFESDWLLSGESLYPGDGRTSTSGQYRLTYQGDGNLVLYSYGSPIWASDTQGTAAGHAAMQGDGNFVVYDASGTPLRHSGTYWSPGANLLVQDDGNVVIYSAGGAAIWSRSEWQSQPPPPPPSSSLTFIINGIESTGEWALPGTDFSNAIAATYGAVPEFWFWSSNSWQQVLPPSYPGILDGAFQLANFLHSLPPGDVNLIAHSHGGNVVLLSQQWSTRPIRRYITLAAPVNWDWYDWRFALNYGVAGRCHASSKADGVQPWGASPYQVQNFLINAWQASAGTYQAIQALINGNYADSFWYFAQSVFDAIEADYWLDTTRYEVEGYTHMFVGLRHTELHTPGAWNALPAFCR